MERKRKWIALLAGSLLAVILELLLAGYGAGRGAGSPEKRVFTSAELETAGYEVTENQWKAVGSDSTIVFPEGQGIGSIELTFKEPVSGDIPVELYYLPEGAEGFDRFRRVERYMFQGTEKARISIPTGEWKKLRLDMHGYFVLDKIEALPIVPPTELSVSGVAAQVKILRLLCLWIFCCGSIILMLQERQERRENVEIAENKDEKLPYPKAVSSRRFVSLDAVRTLAAFLVVAVHVIEPLGLILVRGSLPYCLVEGASIFCLSCNLLFVMISGALLVPWREESFSAFAKKRLVSVLLPFLVYSFFYLRMMCITVAGPEQWIPHVCSTLISGNFARGKHLWLIYELIGLYLVAVPLRYMVRNMPEQAEKLLAIIIVACLGAGTLSRLAGQPLKTMVFLGQWPGIFLMGHLLMRDWMRRYDKIIVGGGMISLAFSTWLSGQRTDFMDIAANTSILMLFIAASLFVILIRIEKYLKPLAGILSFCSRHSYSVLLIHMYVLGSIVYNGILTSEAPRAVQVIAPIVICIVISFILSVVIDRCVVDVLEKWRPGKSKCSMHTSD